MFHLDATLTLHKFDARRNGCCTLWKLGKIWKGSLREQSEPMVRDGILCMCIYIYINYLQLYIYIYILYICFSKAIRKGSLILGGQDEFQPWEMFHIKTMTLQKWQRRVAWSNVPRKCGDNLIFQISIVTGADAGSAGSTGSIFGGSGNTGRKPQGHMHPKKSQTEVDHGSPLR